MSVQVSKLITQGLDEIGDKDGHRTTRPNMLSYYNRAQRVIATETEGIETDAYFDLEANEPRYAYPENAIRVKAIRIARIDLPVALSDYYWIDEAVEEEYRAWTWALRAIGWISHYRARNNWIEFLQNPTTDVPNGGLLTYWKIPDDVLEESPSAIMELPDFVQDHVLEGMKILSRMAGRERAAANEDWQRWTIEATKLRSRIQGRSTDRKPSMRPPNSTNAFRGMR